MKKYNTNKLINIILKKEKGESELITSMVAIAALTVFALFFISVTGDVHSRIAIDQVARTYILKLEAAGTLTATEIDQLKSDLLRIKSVNNAGGSINVVVNNGSGPKSYGQTVTLDIDVPVLVTGYKTITPDSPEEAKKHPLAHAGYTADADATMYGLVTHNTTKTYHVTKQSTAKY